MQSQATIEDLYKVKEKAELVNGEIIILPPDGSSPGSAISNIAFSLKSYEKTTKSGVAFLSKVAFVIDLPHRKSLSASCSFYTGRRTGMKFPEGAPLFAVEVRNEWNYGKKAEQSIADKRADYFAAGTEIVWDVDLQRKTLSSLTTVTVQTNREFSGADKLPTLNPLCQIGE